MENIKFIKVVNDDFIIDVELLAKEIWQEHYIPMIGQEQVAYMLEKFQSQFAISKQIQEGYFYYLVNDRDNQNIGYFSFLLKDDECFLDRIYLKSIVRGKGLGRQSLNFVENFSRKIGCSKISLTVNKNNLGSIKFYQTCGFKTVGPIVQDIGNGFVMDDYKMEKTVQSNEEPVRSTGSRSPAK